MNVLGKPQGVEGGWPWFQWAGVGGTTIWPLSEDCRKEDQEAQEVLRRFTWLYEACANGDLGRFRCCRGCGDIDNRAKRAGKAYQRDCPGKEVKMWERLSQPPPSRYPWGTEPSRCFGKDDPRSTDAFQLAGWFTLWVDVDMDVMIEFTIFHCAIPGSLWPSTVRHGHASEWAFIFFEDEEKITWSSCRTMGLGLKPWPYGYGLKQMMEQFLSLGGQLQFEKAAMDFSRASVSKYKRRGEEDEMVIKVMVAGALIPNLWDYYNRPTLIYIEVVAQWKMGITSLAFLYILTWS